MDTSVRPMSLTADDCTPIAAASTASRAYCAHPAGLAPSISHPAAKPASMMNSADKAQLTCVGIARSPSGDPEAPEAPEAPDALTPCATQVPQATPVM